MHIICSFIEPSGDTLACDDIQNNFEADLHNSQETISKKRVRNPYKRTQQSGHSRGISATESRATLN